MKIIDKFLSSKFEAAGSMKPGETFLVGNDLAKRKLAGCFLRAA